MKTTIILPLYGHSDYASYAINSILKHSAQSFGLLIMVEPVNTAEDEQWLASLPGVWPGPLQIVRNEKRLGYYASVNEAVRLCPTETAILFTSDQVVAPGWDVELLKHLAPNRFVTGRLIESGANLIGDKTIWKRFGTHPANFKDQEFLAFCKSFKPKHELDLPRHYLPMAFYLKDFVRVGRFVGGNDTLQISTCREDLYFLLRGLDAGIDLIEAQRCLTYHFQSGSKRTGALWRGLLNWVYPFGLSHVHRLFTGYVSMIDTLEKKEVARQRVERILNAIENQGKV